MIDAHCHLYDPMLNDFNIDELIENGKKVNITNWIVCSTDLDSMNQALDFCNLHKECYLGAGYYPCDVKFLENEEILQKYLQFLDKNKKSIVVLGEIGLDYYWEKTVEERGIQKKWFIYQIELANKLNLPICIHCRDAIGDLLEILKNHYVKCGFYMHAYNASIEITKELIKLGGYFSIGGVVTYKNADNLRETLKIIPLDRLFIETDLPYLPPVPYRGKINIPEYMDKTLDKISEVKNIDKNELDAILTKNCRDFIKI